MGKVRTALTAAVVATALVAGGCTSDPPAPATSGAASGSAQSPGESAGGTAGAGTDAPAGVASGVTGSSAAPRESASGGSGAATAAKSTTTVAAEPEKVWTASWKRTDLETLGQPVAAGKYVVLYTSTNDVPYLEVLSAKDGKTVWRKAAAPGDAPTNTPFTPAVIGGRVAYLEPPTWSGEASTIAVARIKDGATVRSAEPYEVVARPDKCGDRLCFTATIDGASRGFVMSPKTGAVSARTGVPADARPVGTDGLLSIHPDGKPEHLARVVAGKKVWDHPVEALLGKGYASDNGWGWTYLDDVKLFVGSLAYDRPTKYALGKLQRMFGVRASDGSKAWEARADGVCVLGLPGIDEDVLATLGCAYSKDTVVTFTDDDSVLNSGSAEFQRFDPRTGKPVWSVPIPTRPGKDSWSDVVLRLKVIDANTVLVAGTGETPDVRVDLRSGKTSPVPDDVPLVCSGTFKRPMWGRYVEVDGALSSSWSTGKAVFACDKDTESVDQRQAFPDSIGATVGGLQIVTTLEGVVAGTMAASKDGPTGDTSGTASSASTASTEGTAASASTASSTSTESSGGTVSSGGTESSGGTASEGTASTGSPSAKAPAEKDAAAPKALWTGKGYTPLSEPRVAGKLALLYAEVGGQFSLIGVDPGTGTMKWHRPTYGPHAVPEGDLQVAAVGNRVLYLRGKPGQNVKLVLADARTGKDQQIIDGWFHVRAGPQVCGDDFCLVGFGDDDEYLVRVEPATGQLSIDPPLDESSTIDFAGDNLSIRRLPDDVQVLLASRDGYDVKLSTTKLTPTARELKPEGIQHLSADHVVVVAFDMQVQEGSTGPEVQIGKQQGMVGIDDRSGKVLWKSTGSDQLCLPTELRQSGFPVRCHWDIGARLQITEQGLASKKLNVSLEGFDPRTGKRTWSVPLAPGSGVKSGGGTVGLLDDERAVLNGPKGQLVVSLADGKAKKASPTTSRLCRKTISGSTGYSADKRDPAPDRFELSHAWMWCDGAGSGTPANRPWPALAGVQVKDVRVVLTDEGLQGFDQPAA